MSGSPSRARHLDDAPSAPDGNDRLIGDIRRPDPRPLRGPAAGVPDLSGSGFLELLQFEVSRDQATLGHAASATLRFQHASERRFARLLDFYGVRWEYEPDEFPIAWDDSGAPTAWFRPDFYLPTYDLYIEITTSQQRLITKKNRKVRLLREHHPTVRCKLFYQRDYLALVDKYDLDTDLGDDPVGRREPHEP